MKPNLKMKNKNKGSLDSNDDFDELIDSLIDESDKMPKGSKAKGMKVLSADEAEMKTQLKHGTAFMRQAVKGGLSVQRISFDLIAAPARPLLKPFGRLKAKFLGE